MQRSYTGSIRKVARFPELTRQGEHGFVYDYPEWLIMLIGIPVVKCKEKTNFPLYIHIYIYKNFSEIRV
jgi:hypothetical protein